MTEMSVQDQLRNDLRDVRHDLEHVTQERDVAREDVRQLRDHIRRANKAAKSSGEYAVAVGEYRDEAWAERDRLREQIRKVRELCRNVRDVELDSLPQEIFAVLDDSPHVSDSIKELMPMLDEGVERPLTVGGFVANPNIEFDVVEDEPQHFNLSREDAQAAAKARLAELGVTYTELAQMAADKHFASTSARKLWVLIGGTLDEEAEA